MLKRFGRAANQTVQRTGASRFAQRQIERHRRLAPVADLRVRPLDHAMNKKELIVGILACVVAAFSAALSLRFPKLDKVGSTK
jgi:hypothetical protein